MDENTNKQTDQGAGKPVSQVKLSSVVRDVYSVINYGKKIYANRAVISRRVSAISNIFGVLFTLLYIAYVLISGLKDKLSLSFGIVSIVLICAYAVVLIGVVAAAVCSSKVKTKNAKKLGRFLKILRYFAKLLSLAISITCLVLAITSGSESAAGLAFDTIMIIVSILLVILQGVLLLSGGIGGFIRWLVSPVKRKVKFAAVAMEWYQLASSDEKIKGAAGKVSKKYLDEIGSLLDSTFIPAFGKRYIGAINSDDILLSLGSLAPEQLPVGEGVIKSLFKYALECGYIDENPCAHLSLTGTVSEDEPVKKKGKFFGAIKNKIGGGIADVAASAFDKLISDDD